MSENKETIVEEKTVVEEKPVEKEEKTEKTENTKEVVDTKDTKNNKSVKQKNVISNGASLPPSDDPESILKQVEFYFSDQNLPLDKFLFKQVMKDPNGWVSLSIIQSFSRMKRFGKDSTKIANALRNSKELLEVNEEGTKVRRKLPLNKPVRGDNSSFLKTVYVKGFGEETPTTQFDLEKFFEKFGDVKQVRLRRDDEKKFKSSVYVEFSTLEEAKNFVSLDPKPTFEERELIIKSKPDFIKEKEKEGKRDNIKKKKFNAFKSPKYFNNDNSKSKDSNDRKRKYEETENNTEKKTKLETTDSSEKENDESKTNQEKSEDKVVDEKNVDEKKEAVVAN